MLPKLEDVFGVSSKPVLSYIERQDVDDRFVESLKSDKQIVVYGSSKQGKTSLVSKYLPYDSNIVVRLTPKTTLADIYASILRQSGIRMRTVETVGSGSETTASVGAKVKAMVAMFGGAEASVTAGTREGSSITTQLEEIPFNLELPQDISELITRGGVNKVIILENFHYLDDEKQRQFAFDLRTFQELQIRFVILGSGEKRTVWRNSTGISSTV